MMHWAITHRVKAGCEGEFEAKLHAFAQASMGAEGMAGVHLLRPPASSTSNEFGILRSFESEAAKDDFYASALFADWCESISDLIEANPTRRELSGLEAFFRSQAKSMPPRWKMAFVTFLGVLPTVLLWSNLLGPPLSGMHWLIGAVVINGAVVATLTWAAMPLLTRIFDGWLHRS